MDSRHRSSTRRSEISKKKRNRVRFAQLQAGGLGVAVSGDE